jgi:chemotaxis protein MotB
LVVSLKEMGFFDSGSASIRPGSLNAISRLADVLKSRPENLRIEGHTDNVPIHTARFANNWGLSTARATELIQLLITDYGIPPSHLSAAGYGEFHPVATNDTPEGRAQNRRLDVVILAPFQPIAESRGNSKPVDEKPANAPNPFPVHP